MNDSRPDEGALIERALALRSRHYVELARHAAKFGCTYHEARQVADDALAELVVRDDGAEPVANEQAWLRTVAMRKALKIVLSRHREHESIENELLERFPQTRWSTPEQHLEAMETLRELQELPERYRHPVVLASEGRTMVEIAELLGITVDAATKRVSRGRKMLNDKIGNHKPATRCATGEGRNE